MFGKRKRNGAADGFDPRDQYIPGEEAYVPEEYADGYAPEEYTGVYTPEGYPDDPMPEGYADGYAPEIPYADDYTDGYTDGYTDEYADEYDPEYAEESEPEKPESRSIFRPATRKPNFIVSVLVNTARVILLIGLLAGVAGLGALAGIAKGYVDKPLSELQAEIGEPLSVTYVSSCLIPGGQDGELHYDGFTVYTVKSGDTETIQDVLAD